MDSTLAETCTDFLLRHGNHGFPYMEQYAGYTFFFCLIVSPLHLLSPRTSLFHADADTENERNAKTKRLYPSTHSPHGNGFLFSFLQRISKNTIRGPTKQNRGEEDTTTSSSDCRSIAKRRPCQTLCLLMLISYNP